MDQIALQKTTKLLCFHLWLFLIKISGLAMTLSLRKSLICKKENLVFVDLQDEFLILAEAAGKVFSLNKTARSFWLLLDKPATFDVICEALRTSYAIDGMTCEAHVAELVDELKEMGLLLLRPDAA